MTETLRVRVEDASQAGEARRAAASVCHELGFSEVDAGRVSLLVTEAATNLARHARGGELLLCPLRHGEVAGIEILAVDRGPGMANPARSLRDGFSTGGSPGTGLGALRRLSSAFDLFSEPDKGTVLLCRYWAGPFPGGLPPERLETGAVCVSVTDGEPCGDAWAVENVAASSLLLVCDGLGHGEPAAEASRTATRLFRENPAQGPGEMVETLHRGLRGTRGAALAVLGADPARGTVRFCGIGNIGARIVSGDEERHLVSQSGIVGHEASRIREYSYTWPENSLLVVHSDGLSASWRCSSSPGLASHDPSVVAAVLYRDYGRARDDRTVVVARRRAQGPAPAASLEAIA